MYKTHEYIHTYRFKYAYIILRSHWGYCRDLDLETTRGRMRISRLVTRVATQKTYTNARFTGQLDARRVIAAIHCMRVSGIYVGLHTLVTISQVYTYL